MNTWDQEYEKLPMEQKKIMRRWKKGIKERAGLTNDRNQCPTCGEFFSSTYAFDLHRVGPYGKPGGVQSNRRCLAIPEMLTKGFEKNEYFYWTSGSNPAHADGA